MSKAILVMDMPNVCVECPMHYKSEDVSLGNFTYQRLYRCMLEPENLEDVYLPDILNKKPDWCPLREVPKEKDIDWLASDYEDSRVIGWNDCIDEILRE